MKVYQVLKHSFEDSSVLGTYTSIKRAEEDLVIFRQENYEEHEDNQDEWSIESYEVTE